MSDFQFGLGSGHLPKWMDRIARKHGAQLVNHTGPDGRKTHWFRAENIGKPEDPERANAVLTEIRKFDPTARL